MKPPVPSDCSLAPKLLFVDWLKILANEKQAVQFRSPLVLVCEQKRCSHMKLVRENCNSPKAGTDGEFNERLENNSRDGR